MAVFTDIERREYRSRKALTAYDRQQRARDIVMSAYRRAHPNARRPARDGICKCGDPLPVGEIELRLDEAGHEYHNHLTCKSWACPICAPKRAYARSKEIEAALVAANEAGLKCLFVTFTVPHRKSHSSSFVIDRLNATYKKFTNSHYVRRLKSDFGYLGQIKCLDYTLTDNGIHAHLHTIWMFDFDMDAFDLCASIGAEFIHEWDRKVFNECGKHINKRHGFNIEAIEMGSPDDPDTAKIAAYAAKAISVYCSDGDKDSEHSKHPFDLLNSTATDKDHEQYLDFYKGQKGRRHIFFSHGLKSRLGIDKVEIAPERKQAIVANISYEHAYRLKDEKFRQEFEKRAAGSVSYALDWLEKQTRLQQQFLQRRFPDPVHDPYETFDYSLVRYGDVINDLDDPVNEVSDMIRKHEAEQADFLPSVDRIFGRLEQERYDAAYERYMANREKHRKEARDRLLKNLEKSRKSRRRHPARDYSLVPVDARPPVGSDGVEYPSSDARSRSYRLCAPLDLVDEHKSYVAQVEDMTREYMEECGERPPSGLGEFLKQVEREQRSRSMFSESLFFPEEFEEEHRCDIPTAAEIREHMKELEEAPDDFVPPASSVLSRCPDLFGDGFGF